MPIKPSTQPALPPSPCPPWTDRNSPVFHRTLTPFALLLCFNSSTKKDVPEPREMHLHQYPRASNGQQNPLLQTFQFPKICTAGQMVWLNFPTPGLSF